MIRRRGDRFTVEVYNPATRKKEWVGTFATFAAAEVAQAQAAASFRVSRVETCDSFALRWVTDFPRPAHSTNTVHRYSLKPFIERFRGVPLQALDRATAYAWAQTQPVNYVRVLTTMFNDARNAGLFVGENPFARTRKTRSRGRKDIETLSEAELYELAECAGRVHGPWGHTVFEPAIIFQAFVTTRPGEMFATRRENVIGDELLVTKADNGAGVDKAPKNELARRVVLLPPVLEALKRVPPRLDVPWLFYTKTGRRFTKNSLRYYWDPVRCAFGRPGLDFYELRHAGGSIFTNELEIDACDTALQMGHTDGGHLVRTLYGHPEEKRARERIKKAWERHVEGQGS